MAENFSIVPWGLHPLDSWVKDELNRRSQEENMANVVAGTGGQYSGPKTAWARFFSNGMRPKLDDKKNPVLVPPKTGVVQYEEDSKNGFMMFGVNGFDDSYGFNTEKRAVIGLDCLGNKISIPAASGDSYPYRPPPAVDSVEVSLYGGQNASFSGLCRRARVNWKCYSLDQLEYLTPYFLTPKVTAIVEWGWNNYNPASLIDLSDHKGILDRLLDGKFIMNQISGSSGNYDAMLGFIFNYSFTLNALGGYDCWTEFVNANWLVEGQEYKSRAVINSTKGKDGKIIEKPVKDFVEFVDTDLEKLTLKKKIGDDLTIDLGNFSSNGRYFVVSKDNATNSHSAGYSKRKAWLRMDLVQDIFNRYFQVVFQDIGGNKVGHSNVLDISDTVLCGHPAMKSTDEDILVPNQFAPRLTTKYSEQRVNNNVSSGVLRTAQVETSTYSKLFVEGSQLGAIINNNGLTTEYDDLFSLINKQNNPSPAGKSFPVYEKGTTYNTSNSLPGTYGYLKDLFVSTAMISDLMKTCDSAYRLLEALLHRINDALCGVAQLKVVPHQFSSGLSIIDMNYNPRSNSKSVETLPRFTPGSVNSAYMVNATFTVDLSPEMANQMVAQSSAGIKNGIQVRTGVQQANRFVGSDRLFDVGTLPTGSQNSDDDPPTTNTSETSGRDFDPNSDKWYYFQNKKDESKNKPLLIERDADFMRSIVSSDINGTMIYINSYIMPGIHCTVETLGIGGFTFLGQFTFDHVPHQYSYTNAVWQISDIKQSISNGNWKTVITADVRPLSYVTT